MCVYDGWMRNCGGEMHDCGREMRIYSGKMLICGGEMYDCGREMRFYSGKMLICGGEMCRERGAGLSQGQMPPCSGEDAALWWRGCCFVVASARRAAAFTARLHTFWRPPAL
ncbi:hypothetical protein B7994_05935 [Fibrobacter sp. UWR2]|nr:hypothetical protein B7994_05935 [Fibrobacter sp. UWR2]